MADSCRYQAIALKFRLLSVRGASGASVSNRKMSVIAIFQQLMVQTGTRTDEEPPRNTVGRSQKHSRRHFPMQF
jgi:hypothetical protein